MRYLLLTIILVEAIVLGFCCGSVFILDKQIKKQNSCIDFVHSQDININKFFNEKITDVPSIFLHSEAAVDVLYTRCMWGE